MCPALRRVDCEVRDSINSEFDKALTRFNPLLTLLGLSLLPYEAQYRYMSMEYEFLEDAVRYIGESEVGSGSKVSSKRVRFHSIPSLTAKPRTKLTNTIGRSLRLFS